MSYWCKINFKEVASADDFLQEVEKMKKAMWEQRMRIISDNLVFCKAGNFGDNTSAKSLSVEAWLQRLMRIRLMYWSHLNLFGYCSVGKFDGFESVEFQNSCDQDYEYIDYPKNIRYFKEKVEEFKTLPFNEVQSRMKDLVVDYDVDDRSVSHDYDRRWALYLTIEKELGICQFLYEKSGDTPFMRFDVGMDMDDCELYRLTSSVLAKLDRRR